LNSALQGDSPEPWQGSQEAYFCALYGAIITCITGQLLNSGVIQILYFKSKLLNRRIKRTHKLDNL